MALTTPVTLAATTVGSGTAAVTTGAYTPTANGLQLVIISATGSIGGETLLSVSSTHTGTGAWNFVGFAATTASKVSVWIAYAVTGASPGSGTFTANVNGTGATDVQITPCETTGQDTTTPVDTAAGASNPLGNATTATTPSLTLNTAPATGDLTIGAFAARNVTTSITAGTGFTALFAASHATPDAAQMMEYRTGSTSTTVAAAGMGTVANAGVALIVKVGSGSTPKTLSDTGSGADAISETVTATQAETVAGADALAANAAVTQTETGAGVDAISVVRSITLTDVGSGADALAANASVPLADARPAATDALTATATVPLTDTGTGSDAITTAIPKALSDSATGTDALSANVSLTLTDVATAVDFLQGPTFLSDSATAVDAISVAIATLEIHFSSPVRVAGLSDPTNVWWRHTTYERTISILKYGSSYVEVQGPTNEQIEAADATYLGGHVYVIDATEAAALTAAGYGAGLS